MAFFNGHTHDEYSNITTGLDSLNKLPDLVARAKELGLMGMAITNHDNLSEAIDINRMQKKLHKENDPFVLAIGDEIYLVSGYDPTDGKKERYYHFILIAKDKIGYDALVRFSSAAWYRSTVKNGKRRVPTLMKDIEDLMQDAKGHIIATSACLGGMLPTYVLGGAGDLAKQFMAWCIEQFGADDFYVEIQPSNHSEQIEFNNWVYKNIDPTHVTIATDAHYQGKDDFPIFEAFLRSDEKNQKREVKEFYDYAYLMSEDEARSIILSTTNINDVWLDQVFENTTKIAAQIEFYDLAQDPRIPGASLERPAGLALNLNSEELQFVQDWPTIKWALYEQDEQTRYCIFTCLNALKERGKLEKKYLDRLEEEFDTFKFQSEAFHDNFFKYFNTMQHFLDLAWSIDCAVGPSRGSASGSLICYLMDIVQCDPLQYELPFWRFANKVRTSPLDIDTDFQPSRRADLFKAIREERGELGLTQVATFRKLTLKAAINSAGRGYRSKDFPTGLDADITTYLSSLIEIKRGFVATLKQTLEGDETTGYNVNHQFIKEVDKYPGLMDIIKKIEGVIVGSSTHAAAVILFDDSDRLIDHCSLMRAPNGDICTSLDLHTVEEAGCYKYDFLLLSTLDIQATCFKLLQKYGKIDGSLTLKECFRKYINPNLIDFDQPEIWEKLYNNEVLSIFQWDAASGRKGVLAAKPQSLSELTSLNGLIRLMTVEGEEDQIERFCANKADPERFEREMLEHHVPDELRRIMHEVLDPYNGCAATQESFMVLSQRLVGFSLKEADALRKTVAKKKMAEITKQHELFTSKGRDKNIEASVVEYLWDVVVRPSLGYGFSLNHALPYSIVGVQCILMGGILFHSIYWQAACLLQRSGALDGKSSDYNKIAKAVSLLTKQGVKIETVNINRSGRDFEIDEASNTIYFGLSGVKGLKEATIDSILECRPFESMLDCRARTGADITSVVTLIKAGAFNEFGPIEDHINVLSRLEADQKLKLNGQNYAGILRAELWPIITPELEMAKRFFEFYQYLKKLPNGKIASYDPEHAADFFGTNEKVLEFLKCLEITPDDNPYVFQQFGDTWGIKKKSFKTIYDAYLQPMKQYLIDNQEKMVEIFNAKMVMEWREKYFPSTQTPAQWEIETLGLCFHEHPMTNVVNLSDFDDLPREPQIATIFKTKTGRNIPLYQLTMIAGIVIAKDKLHSSITLLTSTGPVEVKFRKQQFASYDAQISTKIGEKKKQIVERSWLNRGVGLIVHGMRQDDQFIAKTYKNSKMKHTAYKVTSILPSGKLEVQKERKKGIMEDSDE